MFAEERKRIPGREISIYLYHLGGLVARKSTIGIFA